MKRLLASICLLSLVVPAFCRADDARLDLKGKTIKLSVLGVAGWLPSKLPYEMGPEFAKFAKDKYGYDVSFTYADAPFSTLFQKAASSLATKSNEYSLIVSDSQWLGAFTEPGWIVKLDDVIKKNPELDIKWFDPVLESSYQEYPDNSGHKVGLPQETRAGIFRSDSRWSTWARGPKVSRGSRPIPGSYSAGKSYRLGKSFPSSRKVIERTGLV